LIIWARDGSRSFQECNENQNNESSNKAFNANSAAFFEFIQRQNLCTRIYFSKNVNEGAVTMTALATVAIAYFTWTLWSSNREHVKHFRDVERAYLTGGGPLNAAGTHFVLNVGNYGKTTAFLTHYSLFFCQRGQEPSLPLYLRAGHARTPFSDRIAPGTQWRPIEQFEITVNVNPVVYGRFWYTDIWANERYFSFILAIRNGNAISDIANVHPEYGRWT
jgi:hypothetical protein